MIAVDTSVVVAGFAAWHEGHEAARDVLRRRPRLPGHVLIEAYSVLTRLPPPHRASPGIAAAWLERRFQGPLLEVAAAEVKEMIAVTARSGIAGGAVYDALVATTALRAGATLYTRDRRAVAVYQSIGVDYKVI